MKGTQLTRTSIALLLLLFLTSLPNDDSMAQTRPLVIAHRGASGYLPEHTLVAVTLAHGQGADFIEQDTVLTRDNVPVVLHDVHLDTVTNVADLFPERARQDGRFYAIDLTLKEIKQLDVNERIDLKTGNPVFPSRFPVGKSSLKIPTLAEEIELIQGLNQTTGRNAGIYVEVKSPAWHRQQGKDISRHVLDIVAKYGYVDKSSSAFIQCFDPNETKRMRTVLNCQLRLIQLIGNNSWNEANVDFDQMRSLEGLQEIASYADGIGPRAFSCRGRKKRRANQIGEMGPRGRLAGPPLHTSGRWTPFVCQVV